MPEPVTTTKPCSYCRKPILWTVTTAGRPLAVNPDPDPTGNQAVYRDGAGTLKSRGLSADRPGLDHLEWRAVPHIATCPRPPVRRTDRRPTQGVRPVYKRRPW